MGSFGERLRREREMRSVSLDDIAEATKIGTRLLRALEEEHFEVLPGGIFNKGFVRAYAKYLGLNEEEMVADYLQAAGESIPDPRLIAEQNSFRIDRTDGGSGGSRMAGFPIIPVLILLIVIAAGAGGWHIYQERQHERLARVDAERAAAAVRPEVTAPPVEVPNASTQSPSPDPAATAQAMGASPIGPDSPTAANVKPATMAPSTTIQAQSKQAQGATEVGAAKMAAETSSGATSAPSTTGQQFEVTVRPRDKAWVSIKSDGKITVRGIIGPPDVKTIHATDQVVFWTGNAGAVDVTFNGQPVPLAGGPNEVAVLVITPKGATSAKPASAARTQ